MAGKSRPKKNAKQIRGKSAQNLWTASSSAWTSPLNLVTADAISKLGGLDNLEGAKNLDDSLRPFSVAVTEDMLSRTVD